MVSQASIASSEKAPNIHDENFSFQSIDGGEIILSDYKGKAILIANTASFCGFTYQYEGLQKLYEKYKEKGLTVIAIPSADFMQEYDSNDEVKEFCETNFHLTFPISEITKITGVNSHSFYGWLNQTMEYKPRWNFNKILISPDGNVQKFFGSTSNPTSEKILNSIEEILPTH